MWDLMRGKGVASTKLGKGMFYSPGFFMEQLIARIFTEGETVRWSVDGKLFVVQSGLTFDIYNTVCLVELPVIFILIALHRK